MRGVYLVAAELSKLGFIASPTSRSAIGADVLVTDQKCKKAFSVQVKTNARVFGFWLIGKKARYAVSDSHIYVFVNLKNSKTGENIEYFVIPSREVAKRMHYKGEWPHIRRDVILKFKDRWAIFGKAI